MQDEETETLKEDRLLKIRQGKREVKIARQKDFFEEGIYFMLLFKLEMLEHVSIGYWKVS